MNEYLLLMHRREDHPAETDQLWNAYFAKLNASGQFDGGSQMGGGLICRKDQADLPTDGHSSGFIRIRAESLEAAKAFLVDNPLYETGGTVEIIALPKS